jgi:cell division protein ZapA
MAQVEVTVNGRAYKVACENGQEARLEQLAAHLDRAATQLAKDLGQIGETRLLLLAALTVCDELFESRRRCAELERQTQPLSPETAGGAARVLDEAARRIEALAKRVEAA